MKPGLPNPDTAQNGPGLSISTAVVSNGLNDMGLAMHRRMGPSEAEHGTRPCMEI